MDYNAKTNEPLTPFDDYQDNYIQNINFYQDKYQEFSLTNMGNFNTVRQDSSQDLNSVQSAGSKVNSHVQSTHQELSTDLLGNQDCFKTYVQQSAQREQRQSREVVAKVSRNGRLNAGQGPQTVELLQQKHIDLLQNRPKPQTSGGEGHGRKPITEYKFRKRMQSKMLSVSEFGRCHDSAKTEGENQPSVMMVDESNQSDTIFHFRKNREKPNDRLYTEYDSMTKGQIMALSSNITTAKLDSLRLQSSTSDATSPSKKQTDMDSILGNSTSIQPSNIHSKNSEHTKYSRFFHNRQNSTQYQNFNFCAVDITEKAQYQNSKIEKTRQTMVKFKDVSELEHVAVEDKALVDDYNGFNVDPDAIRSFSSNDYQSNQIRQIQSDNHQLLTLIKNQMVSKVSDPPKARTVRTAQEKLKRCLDQKTKLLDVMEGKFKVLDMTAKAKEAVRQKELAKLKEHEQAKRIERDIAKFKPSREFLQALFKQLDESFEAKKKDEAHQRLRYFIQSSMGWLDMEEIYRSYKSKILDFKECFEEFSQSYCGIRMRKEKFMYLEFVENNSIVIEMIKKSQNDPVFKQQMSESSIETQQFINAILKTFELLDTQQDLLSKKETLSDKFKKNDKDDELQSTNAKDLSAFFNVKTLKQIQSEKQQQKNALFARLKGMVAMQQNALQNTGTDTSGKIDLFKVLIMQKKRMELETKEVATGKVLKRGDFLRTETRNYECRGIWIFRKHVWRHHLSKPMDYYETMPNTKTNVHLVTQLFILRNYLEEMFPSNIHPNIGSRFRYINKNIFTNDYLSGMMNQATCQFDHQMYKVYFNIKSDEVTQQVENIEEDQNYEYYSEDEVKGHEKDHVQDKATMATQQQADGGVECCQTNAALGSVSFNNLFLSQVDKKRFYEQIKKFNMGCKDEKDQEKHAMMAYRLIQTRNMVVPCPKFVTFTQHILFLTNQLVTENEAEALKAYLANTKAITEKRVYKLYIDACQMTDPSFAKILGGIQEQCSKHPTTGRVKMQFLQTLIYSNNDFGCESLTKLKLLIPHLFELSLNNVNVSGGTLDGEKFDSFGLLEEMLRLVALSGQKLMKLKLTKMNLMHEGIVNRICYVIDYNKHIISLNVSRTQLLPKQLNTLSNGLALKAANLRNLNLSYNLLNFNEEHPIDLQDSQEFMSNLPKIFQKAKYLNHINFSGMNFMQPQIQEVLEHARKCHYLLSIHMNDNGIAQSKQGLQTDIEFYYDCLEPFQIFEEELLEINRSMRTDVKVNPNVTKKYDFLDIDYNRYLDEYFSFECKEGCCDAAERRFYKDRLILGQERKVVEQFKAMNEAQVHYGPGRAHDSMFDRFVLTRKMNMPGLVFNQRIKADYSFSRFFNIESSTAWQLSKANECYLCDKYQYTVVHLDRSILAQNEGMIEIKNKEFLDKLKRDFQGNYSKYMSLAPLISGTMINRGIGQAQFDRKLKMVSSPLYSLLQLCQSRDFNFGCKNSQQIMKTMELYFQTEPEHLLRQLGINDKLKGWEKVLKQKVSANELMDVKNINIPDFSKCLAHKDYYCFAEYLKAGYHQILIYDPKFHRAYCKDFVVNLNLREDIYPEFPNHTKSNQQKKKIANVWRQWLEDSQEDIYQSIQKEMNESENFLIHKYINCEIDAGNCVSILIDNFDMIKIYQRHLQFTSTQYPQIDWKRIWMHIEKVNANSKEFKGLMKEKIQEGKKPEKCKLTRAQAELAFVRATRYDNVQGVSGALQRFELIEFIMRLARTWVDNAYSPIDRVAPHLAQFLFIYIKPLYDNSAILEQRAAIRDSRHLNQLLYDNFEGLKQVYEISKRKQKSNADAQGDPIDPEQAAREKKTQRFNLQQAKNLFGQIKHPNYDINDSKIEQCFQFSMMTILDEHSNMNKYKYLTFVEFLDMLCRICIVAIDREETLDHRCHWLLELIYGRMYSRNLMSRDSHPLYAVDEELR